MNGNLTDKEIETLKNYRKNIPIKRRKAYDAYCSMAQSGEVLRGWLAYDADVANRPLSAPQSMYDPIRQALKRNMAPEHGAAIVDEIKRKKATSAEGFVERHGAEDGMKRFKLFQESSKKSWDNTVAALGIEGARKKFKAESRRSKHYYIARGYTEDSAQAMAGDYQKLNSGVFREFYLKDGVAPDDVDVILAEINPRKAGFSYERYAKLYPDSWRERIDAVLAKRREALGLPPLTPALIANKADYYREVDKHTRASVILHGDKVDGIELRGRAAGHDLDHVFSKIMGFYNGVPPEVIGHWTNLRICKDVVNRSKRGRCDIDVSELYERYENANKENSYSRGQDAHD